MFTLRQLEIFTSVAKFQSISKAAENIPLSKAAVSQAIKELELQLGHQLFVREKRHLVISADGIMFLEHSQKLLQQAGIMYQTFAQTDTLMQLRFGGTLGACSIYAPSLINHWSCLEPEIKIHYFAGNTSRNCKMVKNFEIDLAIVEGMPSDDVLSHQLLLDELCYIASISEPADSIDDVINPIWLVREAGSGTAEYWESNVRPVVRPSEIIEVPQSMALLEYVVHGMGISCIPKVLAQMYIDAGLVKELTGPPLPARDIYLVWNPALNSNTALWVLIDQAIAWSS